MLLTTNISNEKCSFDLIQGLKIYIKQWEHEAPYHQLENKCYRMDFTGYSVCWRYFLFWGWNTFQTPSLSKGLSTENKQVFSSAQKRENIFSSLTRTNHSKIHFTLRCCFNIEITSLQAERLKSNHIDKLPAWQMKRGQDDKMIWYDICQYFLLSEQR